MSRRSAVKACAALALSAGLSAPLAIQADEIKLADGDENAAAISGPVLHHILRIHLPLDVAERRTAEVIDYCKRTGCGEVLLFTTSYDHAPSFQTLDDIRDYVKAIQPRIEELRHAGVTVSVNVLQTLGHVYFPAAQETDFPFQRRVYAGGRVSTEGACPLDPKLHQWVTGAYKIYAGLRPPVLFVDDDFRTFMAGEISCFCPLHLRAISDLAGRSVTREEVVQSLLGTAWPAPDLRRHYYTATTRGFVDLATQIRAAVDTVSPETRVGLMTAAWPRGAQGVDVAAVAQALAGPHCPLLRPQISFYSEDFIRDAASAFLNPARMRATLPENFEYWPEIENYQYSLYAKSTRCTFAEMATTVLNGFNHLALNVFDMFGSPLGDSARLVKRLETGRRFLDQLHRLVPEGSRAQGVRVFEHRDQLRVRRTDSLGALFASDQLTRRLPLLGFPIAYGVDSPWQVITGDDVLALDDQALDRLLAPGALLDVSAASALELRGQAKRIGVKVGPAIPLDELGYEQVDDPEISPSLPERAFPLRPLVQAGDWRRLIATDANARMGSKIRNYRREVVGPGLLLTENANGERFGIFAFSGLGNRHLMENLMRPEQIRQTLGWIARRPVPLATHHSAPYLWPIWNHTADGRTVIGLVNLATDSYDTLPLIVARDLSLKNLSIVTADGNLSPAKVGEPKPLDKDTFQIELQHHLEPFEVGAFVAG